ncbi:neurogenic locus notch homolog protein 1-like isoform X2 [Xenia sp. Carnegie-2017]|uniref:neurogenic locus notch homolog protein 1-like isoform X2 n=1 Tax=Xenia sp. Carnegie-2017 TaxID=2897299 RepID=UPI001F03BA29|nr:neurogenic locus notch homolog protein 1-like isoform X2 [Xenia sp. Carnegie-2017]
MWNSGVQTRTRRKISSGWWFGRCSGYSLRQTRACNRNKCRNRGWSWHGRCICYSGWTGKCCNKRRPRNCVVSRWSSWSSCSHQCGNAGVQTRTRRKIRTESNGGSCPYSLRRTRACNRNKCRNRGRPTYGRCICYSGWTGTCCSKKSPINCVVSSWTSWSSCSHQCGNAGVQTQTRRKIRSESNGGSCPYILRRTRACNRNKCHNGGRPTYGRCICKSGWTGTCCNKDIDECALSTDNCHTKAICTNNNGSFSCKCNSGYSGNGIICKDIDECSLSIDNCHQNSTCVNTNGSFSCSCNVGYSGNGTVCEDIDECSLSMDNCHQNSTCINSHGLFSCNCDAGFTGNGTVCEEIKPCESSPCKK